jgi:hypothetical protein
MSDAGRKALLSGKQPMQFSLLLIKWIKKIMNVIGQMVIIDLR